MIALRTISLLSLLLPTYHAQINRVLPSATDALGAIGFGNNNLASSDNDESNQITINNPNPNSNSNSNSNSTRTTNNNNNNRRCSSRSVRKEIRSLSSSELRSFQSALRQLKTNGGYDRLCQIHFNNVPVAHSTPYFLPWHREFIRQFEQELQSVNPGIVLPYWDWSIDSQAPERSPVLSSRYLGGQGGRCVSDGPSSGWQCSIPNDHCLGRSFSGGESIGAFYSPELLSFTLDGTSNYDEFRNAIEGPPHGNVHNNIGGDMSTMHSCNDPIFYLHHAFVDKLWADWQDRSQENLNSFGGEYQGRQTNLDDELEPFDKTVRSTMNTNTDYCYTYSGGRSLTRRSDLSRRAVSPFKTPGPLDREDLLHLRSVPALSDQYIEMFGLDRIKVREQERRAREETDRLNAIGHISDVALGAGRFLQDSPRPALQALTEPTTNLVDSVLDGSFLEDNVLTEPLLEEPLVDDDLIEDPVTTLQGKAVPLVSKKRLQIRKLLRMGF